MEDYQVLKPFRDKLHMFHDVHPICWFSIIIHMDAGFDHDLVPTREEEILTSLKECRGE